jgi:hypothetical protein
MCSAKIPRNFPAEAVCVRRRNRGAFGIYLNLGGLGLLLGPLWPAGERDIGRKRLGCMRPQFAAYPLVFGGYDWDVIPLWVKDEEILAIGQGHFGDAAAVDGAHSG